MSPASGTTPGRPWRPLPAAASSSQAPSTTTAPRRSSGWMPILRGWCPAIRSGGGDVTMAQLIPGGAISLPDVLLGAVPASADFYLKWVFRSDDAVLTRFLLQVTKGA